jgi:hypothetical protein
LGRRVAELARSEGRIGQGRNEEEAKKKEKKRAHRSTRRDMEPSELAFGCRARRSLYYLPSPPHTDTTDEIPSIPRGTRSHPGAHLSRRAAERVAASRSLHRARHCPSKDQDPADSSGWDLVAPLLPGPWCD